MNNPLRSAIAGAIATAPMTVVMSYLHKHLPFHERYPLPPRKIAMNVAEEMGLKKRMNEKQKLITTMLSHFSFGALAGALYSPLIKKTLLPKFLSGISYGLLVWGASYLNFLPATGLYRSAAKMPARRNALMIVAHFVWGAVLGIVYDELEQRKKSWKPKNKSSL